MANKINFPHFHVWKTSAGSIWITIATLVPVAVWTVFLFGSKALVPWLVSVTSAVVCQVAADFVTKKKVSIDASALLTGMLIACALPPGIPFYVPIASAAFAIIVVKCLFGGFGSNWLNPALGGIAFAFVNWPSAMKSYILPRIVAGVDGLSAATPVAFARSVGGASGLDIMANIQAAGFPVSRMDSAVTGFLNASVFEPLGAALPPGYIDFFLGFKPGSLGDCALLFILLGSIVLFSLKIARMEAPIAMVSVFAILTRLFGSGLGGDELVSGDILFALSSGSILFVALYNSTDPVTSPISGTGLLIYGALAGLFSFAFSRWGTMVEGTAFALLLANLFVPAIDDFYMNWKRKTLKAQQP